ncbi:hypothetical protein NLJ89_g2979 [Agrocybe chaxingu]|uniref:Uncharacterized protein n=1 Tax=Agrocybe chaxingu TaxID=84603 RepID=A0A9W8MVY5_9AGAR|nr:hypothetical protein NLJ89_g2979 [Agrocybe chaxingu]
MYSYNGNMYANSDTYYANSVHPSNSAHPSGSAYANTSYFYPPTTTHVTHGTVYPSNVVYPTGSNINPAAGPGSAHFNSVLGAHQGPPHFPARPYNYEDPNYLDALVAKWRSLGCIPAEMTEPSLLHSFAFTLEHGDLVPTSNANGQITQEENLRNLLTAIHHSSSYPNGISRAYTVYTVAYSVLNVGLPAAYGNSAPRGNTRPKVEQDAKERDIQYRLVYAYPGERLPERSKTDWSEPLQCGEMLSLPGVFQRLENYKGEKILVNSLALQYRGRKQGFCDNCARYVTDTVITFPGLRVVDEATGLIYQSKATRGIWGDGIVSHHVEAVQKARIRESYRPHYYGSPEHRV